MYYWFCVDLGNAFEYSLLELCFGLNADMLQKCSRDL
jgi:hypothetical protein